MNRALQIIGVVILCLAICFAEPASTAAIATAVGEVFLNGSALNRSSTILEGDRLVTGRSAALILHLPGSSIHIGPDSEATYRGKTLELLSGSTEVQGREAILCGAYTLSPAGESRFTVRRERAQTAVHLLHGSLNISRADEVQTITAPGEYNFQDDAPIPAVKHRAVGKALPIAAGAGTSVVIAHWLTGKEAATSTSCVSGKSPTSCK